MQLSSLDLKGITKETRDSDKTSTMASIVSYLEDFGLTQKEAIVYYYLSRLGSAAANEIASVTKFNRLQTYRSVKGLLDRGLVEISLERPRKYTPLKIEHAISLLEQEAANRILQLKSKKPFLLQKWSEASDFPIPQLGYTFRIVQGSNNVLKFALMLYELAQKEVDFIIKGDEVMRWILHGADDALQRASSKQIVIRGLSEFDDKNLLGIQKLLEFCNVRHVTSSALAPLALIDGKEVLICLTNGRNGLPENAIWTNHPELVEMLNVLFNVLWANSKDGKLMLEETGKKGSLVS